MWWKRFSWYCCNVKCSSNSCKLQVATCGRLLVTTCNNCLYSVLLLAYLGKAAGFYIWWHSCIILHCVLLSFMKGWEFLRWSRINRLAVLLAVQTICLCVYTGQIHGIGVYLSLLFKIGSCAIHSSYHDTIFHFMQALISVQITCWSPALLLKESCLRKNLMALSILKWPGILLHLLETRLLFQL